MAGILDVCATATTCLSALLYLFLLNDQWRIKPLWRWLFWAASGPLSVWMSVSLPLIPAAARPLIACLFLLPCCWIFSSVRDGRFLFVVATALLFSYMCTVLSSMMGAVLNVHRLFFRLPLNAIFLLLGLRFFRAAFWDTYHVLKKGWLIFTLMPVSLLVLFLSMLSGPYYAERYGLVYVRAFTYLLALFTVVFYYVSFQFFRRLGRWQRVELGNAVLTAQIAASSLQSEGGKQAEEFGRILRHDLRHYLRILSSCLREGDSRAAQETVIALVDRIRRARAAGSGGAASDD